MEGEVEGEEKGKEEEGEQKGLLPAFYKEEGIGTGRRERLDWGGSG